MQIPGDFNELLHRLRSRELARTQPVPQTMVSVGASDLHYFDWIGANLGWPERHIGLEFYRPRPENLPAGVEWIPNTAGNMCDVESEVVDLVFAGQTIEHLWYEELAGFFIESARVLKPGGRLVFDSPNRRVTTREHWNHPEHTVELIHEEAMELCRLAGFDMVRCVGHWLCLDGEGRLLPVTQTEDHGEWTGERRVEEGEARPEACFNWWIEARRNTSRCDVIGVYNYARRLSQDHFPYRMNCLMQSRVPDGNHGSAAKGQDAWLVFGPLAPLPPGDWLIRFTVDPYQADGPAGHADVCQSLQNRVLTSVELPAKFEGGAIDIPLHLPQTEFGLEFRLYSNGAAAMRAKIEVQFYRRGIA
jgi:SAM-dependent methyltransferase